MDFMKNELMNQRPPANIMVEAFKKWRIESGELRMRNRTY